MPRSVESGPGFGRAVVAFLALPGVVAYAVPQLLAPETLATASWRRWGIGLLALGTVLLMWCVRDFYVAGRGTLAPWSPPRHLVTTGLYRWSRNPMYGSVLLVLAGWSVLYASRVLAVYAMIVALAFHLRIRRYEEPRLLASFGEEWLQYRRRVSRWLTLRE